MKSWSKLLLGGVLTIASFPLTLATAGTPIALGVLAMILFAAWLVWTV